MRETLTDYSGLFNCLRPDEPIDLYARDATEEPAEVGTCDYCKSDDEVVAVFTLRDDYTLKLEILYLCADCINQEHIFMGKTILRMTKLNNENHGNN